MSYRAGLPPADILADVVDACAKAGSDVVKCLRRCTTVTNEWVYTEGSGPYKDRFAPRWIQERTVPVAHKHLDEIVNPQPEALKVGNGQQPASLRNAQNTDSQNMLDYKDYNFIVGKKGQQALSGAQRYAS